ncbi:MAG: sigma-70 family RNA polymerase sigma factor [Planctomycetes bacterium]|nr:sigma-70 family RNA polymerase sigma factor [Planctomycetota bacterium]NBY01227.1 sigma-70 family RNA polymerase sigma factor [Planctomycetota bacterium]
MVSIALVDRHCFAGIFSHKLIAAPALLHLDVPIIKQSRTEERVQEEFQKLYTAHCRAVWAVAYARSMNAETANDILQESFLRLWREMLKGLIIRQMRPWLIRVARNLSEDVARGSFQRNGTFGPEMFETLDSKSESPGLRLETLELHQQIREGLQEIAPQDREILTMRYALDYEVPDIAKALELQPSAVHMRLSRARLRLAEILKSMGVEAPGK